jgi:hypothetical protein
MIARTELQSDLKTNLKTYHLHERKKKEKM